MYTVEYRRKTGCTINVGMMDLKAKDEENAKDIFLKEVAKEYPLSDFEIIRIVKMAETEV